MTPLNVLIVINAINSLGNGKPLVVGGLAPASEPNNNGIMLANNVTIQGTLGAWHLSLLGIQKIRRKPRWIRPYASVQPSRDQLVTFKSCNG